MSEPTPPSPPLTQPPPPKQRGCFFYGCATALLIVVFIGIAGFFAVRYALNKFVAFAEQYTETTAMTLPKVQMSAVDYEQLQKRVSAFKDALNARKAIGPLVLTGDDINALIGKDPAWGGLNGRVYVTIEGDRITGRVSIPLREFAGRVPGLSRLKGRYLNGSGGLSVSLANRQLVVMLQSLKTNGQSPPPQILAQLQSLNLAQNVMGDAKTAELIGRLESIEVKDGSITIKTRAKE